MKIDHLPKIHFETLKDFVAAHIDLFARSTNDTCKLKDYELDIDIADLKTQVSIMPTCIPYKLRQPTQKILEQYLRLGIVEYYDGDE